MLEERRDCPRELTIQKVAQRSIIQERLSQRALRALRGCHPYKRDSPNPTDNNHRDNRGSMQKEPRRGLW